MAKILILADDFTGALDAGAQFVQSGARIKVINDNEQLNIGKALSETDVLVVHTNSRHASADTAFRRIQRICEKVDESGNKNVLLYKKTDSALRGCIGTELSAVLKDGKYERLFFVPAYPKLNRVTQNGRQYIDGVLVNESSFASDPLNPVTSSYLPDILQKNGVSVYLVPEDQDLKQLDISPKGIYVFDATTDERLQQIAFWMEELREPYAAAGCAGFARYLPGMSGCPERKEIKPLKIGRPLIVLGSVHSQTIRQIHTSEAWGYEVINVTQFPDFNKESYAPKAEEVTPILERFNQGGRLILATDELDMGRRDAGDDQWIECAMNTANSFGKLIAALIGSGFDGVLVISGGDTLYGVLTTLEGNGIEPLSAVEEGVIFARMDTKFGQQYIVTKSGGMGSENVFQEIETYLLDIAQKEN